MSKTQPRPAEIREALEVAIVEHPAEVAELLDRLGLVNDLLDVTELATGAMDDEMIVSLAGMSSSLVESADGLATPETAQLTETVGQNAADLDQAVQTVLELEQSGTLDDLAALAEVVSLMSGAMDDEMVASLAGFGGTLGELADTAAEPDTARGLESMLSAVGEANTGEPEKVGMIGLFKAMRDDDVQAGLGYLIAVARALGGELQE